MCAICDGTDYDVYLSPAELVEMTEPTNTLGGFSYRGYELPVEVNGEKQDLHIACSNNSDTYADGRNGLFFLP